MHFLELTYYCFCVSEKLHRKYSQNWTKQKPNIQKFTEASREPKKSRRGAKACPHSRAVWPRPWPHPLYVWPPWSTFDDAPLLIKTPWQEKPEDLIKIPERYHDPLPPSTQDREGPEALPGTLPKRGITTRGLLHCHACLQSDEWVVYLRLWVHISS
jgi:hypothetical protein